MCLEDVRNIVGHKVVGISIHSIEELHKTDVLYADCVGVGPMYTTSSKPDAQEPCGPERIAELQAQGLNLPCVGIGGITLDNTMAVLKNDLVFAKRCSRYICHCPCRKSL